MDNNDNCLLARLEDMQMMRAKLMELLAADETYLDPDPEQMVSYMAGLNDIWQSDTPTGAGLVTVLSNVSNQLGPVGALMISKMFTCMIIKCIMHELKELERLGRTGELDYLFTEQGIREQTAVVKRAIATAGGAPWERKDADDSVE